MNLRHLIPFLALFVLLLTSPTANAATTGSHSFDGNGDYLLVPHDSALNGRSLMAIEAWVRHDGTKGVCQTIVGKRWATGYWFGICPTNNYLRLTVRGQSFDGNIAVPANEWTHVAVKANSSFIAMYVNGVFAGSADSDFLPPLHTASNSEPLGIGADYNGQLELSGELSQVIIWDSEIYEDNVMRDWARTTSRSMTAYWPLTVDGQDVLGNHHATAQGNTTVSTDDPPNFPYEPIFVPELGSAPTVDGRCDAAEYGSVEIPLIYPESQYIDKATIRVAATPTHLYICATALEIGNDPNHKFAAFIDTISYGGSQYNQHHFRLWTEQPQLVSGEWEYDLVAEQGNMNAWTPVGIDLSADVSLFFFAWTTEMRVSRADLGGLNGEFSMLFAHYEAMWSQYFMRSWPQRVLNSYQFTDYWKTFYIGESIPTAVQMRAGTAAAAPSTTPILLIILGGLTLLAVVPHIKREDR